MTATPQMKFEIQQAKMYVNYCVCYMWVRKELTQEAIASMKKKSNASQTYSRNSSLNKPNSLNCQRKNLRQCPNSNLLNPKYSMCCMAACIADFIAINRRKSMSSNNALGRQIEIHTIHTHEHYRCRCGHFEFILWANLKVSACSEDAAIGRQ